MAAGKRLRTHVHVHQDDGTVKVYGPDSDIPAEDLKKIGDHAFLQDGEEPVVDGPAGTVVNTADEGDQPKSRRKS